MGIDIDWVIDAIASRLRDMIPIGVIDIGGLEGGGRGPRGRTAVPDVRGLPVDDARSTLAREGFRVEYVELEPRPAPVMGTIVDQTPAAGTRLRRGRRVRISVHHPQRRASE